MQSIGKEKNGVNTIHEILEIIKDSLEIVVLVLTVRKLTETKKPNESSEKEN